MFSLIPDRRQSERRGCPRGGRRATDVALVRQALPACPGCGRLDVAEEVESSESGWWFRCRDCDQLWDDRDRSHAFIERCAVNAGSLGAETDQLLVRAQAAVERSRTCREQTYRLLRESLPVV